MPMPVPRGPQDATSEIELDVVDAVLNLLANGFNEAVWAVTGFGELGGEGMPALRGSRRGSLHVRLDVAVPTALDDEQRRLLEDVDRTLGPEAYVQKPDENEGFFGRLKSALR